MLNRQEQRVAESARVMNSIQMWCHLRNLVHAILAGDASRVCEFQQAVQYAPPEMKAELLQELEGLS